ncbi:MAG TPA: DUF4901 domain-containing protein [Bacillales bacterium]|nr:DUF4901 domain-containing protein [Bacillales bacterium]
MSMDLNKLRSIAKSIVSIPDHYHLVMEDSIPIGAEKERCFIWEDRENDDNKIEVSLDLQTGQLIRLDMDAENEKGVGYVCEADEANKLADSFLLKHNPNHASYKWVYIEKGQNNYYITYQEEVGGLPLPDTGCEVTVNDKRNISRYHLNENLSGATNRPLLPSAITATDTVRGKILDEMRMQLTIAAMHSSMYEIEETKDEYRLVYEPILEFRIMDAVTGNDLFGCEHYVMPPSHLIVSNGTGQHWGQTSQTNESERTSTIDFDDRKVSALEKQLGLHPEQYVQVKSKDDGERIHILYKRKEKERAKELEQDALSVDAYMKRKWGNQLKNLESTCMIQIEKSTGRLVGFTNLDGTNEGKPILSRQQCWQKAELFLYQVFPDYLSYLQLEEDQIDPDEEPRLREFFYLPVFISGIPVSHERIMISVSTVTGEICAYMGVSYEMIRKLAQYNFQPVISADEAFKRYVDYMKIQLKWFIHYDEEPPVYKLVYESTTSKDGLSDGRGDHQQRLRYIDACSGELIWDKKMSLL